MIEYLKKYLKINDVEFKEKIKLSDFSAIRIGGEANIVTYPDTANKLVALLSFCQRFDLKYKIVGNMSNLLPLDDGYDGIIVKTDKINSFEISENNLKVGCGVKLPLIATKAAIAGLSGMEGICGIPGQVGGSVRGNAGAFGREISDIIVSCEVYLPTFDEITTLLPSELDFSYRSSIISSIDLVILSAEFKLKKSDKDSVFLEMQRLNGLRKNTQPISYPSLGSFFKRTENCESAARLIDLCGLKGERVGDAAVSDKHAGFIVNLANATSYQVLTLASVVEERVYERFGTRLKREVEILN